MAIDTSWTTTGLDLITNSDFGFLGNLVPLILIFGVSWAISKKPRHVLFIQFPLVLAFKVIFPFFNVSFVMLSFALFVMNIIGSRGDLLADVKEVPSKTRDYLYAPTPIIKAKRQAFKEDQRKVFDTMKEYFRRT